MEQKKRDGGEAGRPSGGPVASPKICSDRWLQHGHHEGPDHSSGAIPSHSGVAMRRRRPSARAAKKHDYCELYVCAPIKTQGYSCAKESV